MDGLNAITIKSVSTEQYAVKLVQIQHQYAVLWVKDTDEKATQKAFTDLNTALAVFATALFDLEGQ